MFSSVLTAIGGVISALTTEHDSYLASAFLNGLACGIALLITISEAMSDPAYRGRVSSLDSIGSTSGMFIYSICTFISFNDFGTYVFELSQQIGVVTCVFSVLAFIFAFKTVDSPITQLIIIDECGAFQKLMDLNGEECASFDTYNHFEELKNFVVDDRKLTFSRKIGQGITPFITLAIVRTFFTLSAITPMFFAAWTSSQLESTEFAIIIYGGVRVLGASISHFVLLDKLGRKPFLYLSTLAAGGLLMAVGYLMNTFHSYKYVIILWFLVGTQLFAGLGEGASSVYMTEAFAPHVKHLFVFLILALENVAVCLVFNYWRFNYNDGELFYSVGVGFFVSFIITLFMLPETRKLSLRDAKHRFSKGCC